MARRVSAVYRGWMFGSGGPDEPGHDDYRVSRTPGHDGYRVARMSGRGGKSERRGHET